MNENGGKNNAILLTVIGIATLLVVVTGATFAYFAAIVKGSDTATSVYIQAGDGGTREISGGEPISLTGIYPRADAWASQTFTVKFPAAAGAADDVIQNTQIDLYIESNTFKANYLKMVMAKDASSSNYTEVKNNAATQTSIPSSGTFTLVTGTRKRNTKTTMTYTLSIYFPELNENQNTGTEQTAKFYMMDKSED